MFCEPLSGWRQVAVRERRTKIDWAKEVEELLRTADRRMVHIRQLPETYGPVIAAGGGKAVVRRDGDTYNEVVLGAVIDAYADKQIAQERKTK
jgi:hypothetical protein